MKDILDELDDRLGASAKVAIKLRERVEDLVSEKEDLELRVKRLEGEKSYLSEELESAVVRIDGLKNRLAVEMKNGGGEHQ